MISQAQMTPPMPLQQPSIVIQISTMGKAVRATVIDEVAAAPVKTMPPMMATVCQKPACHVLSNRRGLMVMRTTTAWTQSSRLQADAPDTTASLTSYTVTSLTSYTVTVQFTNETWPLVPPGWVQPNSGTAYAIEFCSNLPGLLGQQKHYSSGSTLSPVGIICSPLKASGFRQLGCNRCNIVRIADVTLSKCAKYYARGMPSLCVGCKQG